MSDLVQCENCRWFSSLGDPTVGECRVHPPRERKYSWQTKYPLVNRETHRDCAFFTERLVETY